jgi:uncharacterized protein YhbP (UPF0306 family)
LAIEPSRRRIGRTKLRTIAEELLEASTLCAIATVARGSRAHVNTAYFAWTRELRLIWLSNPSAAHSRNLRATRSTAVAVYDSSQTWGEPDRGIQLFGVAGETSRDGEAAYAARFPGYEDSRLDAYRFYELVPRRVKLFDERALGPGTFVTARVTAGGTLEWERTEVYR